jgi:hypothetical protein
MLAMCAARLDEPEQAINFLRKEKSGVLPRSDARSPAY